MMLRLAAATYTCMQDTARQQQDDKLLQQAGTAAQYDLASLPYSSK
jgi:hypothetical protein